MKKYVILLVLVFLFFYFKMSNINYIPADSIRFRIIPNSNSIEDIYAKEKVLESIYNEITGYESENIELARKIIDSKLEIIDEKVNKTLNEYNHTQKYEIKYGLNYFPKKTYNNKTYDAGYYESLVITLGEGEGDNFWCVLFPPLCLLEVEEEKDDIEFSSKIKEIIMGLFK